MKQLIIIVVCLLIISCNTTHSECDMKPVVISIEKQGNYCLYTTVFDYSSPMKRHLWSFQDTCGKYEIGDTIKFSKRYEHR